LAALNRSRALPSTTAIFVGGLLLAAFFLVEKRRGAQAMMPLTMFSSPAFVGVSLLTFLLYGALGGLLVLLPYALIEMHGYSATEAGAALLPIPIVISLASPALGRFAARVGPRLPLTVGSLLVAVGLLLTIRIDGSGSYWADVLPAVLVVAVGLSGAVAPLTSAVLGSVDAAHTGVASGFNSAVARTGGLVATALLAGLLASRGAALASQLGIAAIVGAAASVLAGASAWRWL
jgi:predicted MFS family arabinose efflux permease